jgi:hypothetical protein
MRGLRGRLLLCNRVAVGRYVLGRVDRCRDHDEQGHPRAAHHDERWPGTSRADPPARRPAVSRDRPGRRRPNPLRPTAANRTAVLLSDRGARRLGAVPRVPPCVRSRAVGPAGLQSSNSGLRGVSRPAPIHPSRPAGSTLRQRRRRGAEHRGRATVRAGVCRSPRRSCSAAQWEPEAAQPTAVRTQ